MNWNTARPVPDTANGTFSIRTLLLTRGFDATLSFLCTLCVFSLD